MAPSCTSKSVVYKLKNIYVAHEGWEVDIKLNKKFVGRIKHRVNTEQTKGRMVQQIQAKDQTYSMDNHGTKQSQI